ncbi:LlaJI family restriction endonuclease [Streptococcus danieliae]|uniref:LlaJI family restriction endonuclease n=1 Tax=Streptococcus danieliae TaxID=747656 RepID=A0A7X3G9X5_9STRE|nr:hypothetical protein [Streptococcus danieliae]MVX59705.1 LlaJI family restriction endonuclease [Streptococcus danieliae]
MIREINRKVFVIDGEILSQSIINEFDLDIRLGDYKYNTYGVSYCNFVGFVINRDGDILISFPKHYEDLKNPNVNINSSDIRTLFQVIMLYTKRTDTDYLNREVINDIRCSFPFQAFYEVLDYYKRFGLYREIEQVTKPGYTGKISWKETIRKSRKVFDENNLLFLPLQISKNYSKEVFLSDCMSFVLTYTIRNFPLFIEEQVPLIQSNNFDFWNNRQFVLQKLNQIKQGIFKDSDKKLVHALINFFSNINHHGWCDLKHYNFQNIWETMVEVYLNKCFVDVRSDGLFFDIHQLESSVMFTKHNEKIDIARGFELNPDHYFIKNDRSEQYIFDSKYYRKISSLNYKQVSYHSLMKHKAKVTHSALITPIEDSKKFGYSRKHIETSGQDGDMLIWEHYLSVKEVMDVFLRT